MASRMDTYTHTHTPKSDYKKSGACCPVPGLKMMTQ